MVASSQKYGNIWQNCLSDIKAQTSQEEFARWFEPIIPIDFDGTTLQLGVPNKSYVHHIEKNCMQFLRPILHKMFGLQTRMRYVTPAETTENTTASNDAAIRGFVNQDNTPQIKNPFGNPSVRRPVIDSQLSLNYTFATHIEGECNRLARSAGMAIADNPGKTAFNPLYIFGNSGLGKTHIAQAIGMEVKLQHPHMQVLYVSMSKFQAQFTSAMLNREFNDFIQFYQMIDVLIIDDIQELSGKEKTQNAFFNIFNHLHLSGKQLILTSDKPPVELKDIEQRLLTRFKWGLTAELLPPDYETKIKIIKNKATKLQTELPEDVIVFLANNINANIREIEGALSALVANARFMNKSITVSLAKEVLKLYVTTIHKEVNIDQIKKAVCEHFNITADQLEATSRKREVVQARQIAMYLCKQSTKMSLKAIGAAMGGKNHATVLHACKTIINLAETDKEIKQHITDVKATLSIG